LGKKKKTRKGPTRELGNLAGSGEGAGSRYGVGVAGLKEETNKAHEVAGEVRSGLVGQAVGLDINTNHTKDENVHELTKIPSGAHPRGK